MDYRLLPETSLSEQLNDVKDVEPWLRTKLPRELKDDDISVDTEKIVVVGASAGAHLALLTVVAPILISSHLFIFIRTDN